MIIIAFPLFIFRFWVVGNLELERVRRPNTVDRPLSGTGAYLDGDLDPLRVPNDGSSIGAADLGILMVALEKLIVSVDILEVGIGEILGSSLLHLSEV